MEYSPNEYTSTPSRSKGGTARNVATVAGTGLIAAGGVYHYNAHELSKGVQRVHNLTDKIRKGAVSHRYIPDSAFKPGGMIENAMKPLASQAYKQKLHGKIAMGAGAALMVGAAIHKMTQ